VSGDVSLDMNTIGVSPEDVSVPQTVRRSLENWKFESSALG